MAAEGEQVPPPAAETFETLLTTVATQLLGAPLASFDEVVTDALARLVAFCGAERSTMSLVDPADGMVHTTHAVGVSGVPPVPLDTVAEVSLPWITREVRQKHLPVILGGLHDIPAEETVDVQTLRALRVKSIALFPIVAGGQFLGAFTFGTMRVEQAWPQPLIDRMGLISEVFAGALLRREHERTLRVTLAEVTALRERLAAENEYLRERSYSAEGFEDIVGESPEVRSVLFQAEQVAHTDSTVLLLGETGTGKELVAKAIHAKSPRRARALVTVNCAALPPALIESELFGHG